MSSGSSCHRPLGRLVDVMDLEAEDEVTDAAEERSEPDPHDEQPGRTPGVAHRPEGDHDLEDPRDEGEPPELDIAVAHGDDDVEGALDEQVPADEHGQGAERLAGVGEGEPRSEHE